MAAEPAVISAPSLACSSLPPPSSAPFLPSCVLNNPATSHWLYSSLGLLGIFLQVFRPRPTTMVVSTSGTVVAMVTTQTCGVGRVPVTAAQRIGSSIFSAEEILPFEVSDEHLWPFST